MSQLNFPSMQPLGLRAAAIVAALLSVTPAHAEEEAATSSKTQYVELKPAFVTNYQSDRMGYIKADITLQVNGQPTADAIDHHNARIRHQLIMLLSSQSGEQLASADSLKVLKQDALQVIVGVLEAEGDPVDVSDILFTTFVME